MKLMNTIIVIVIQLFSVFLFLPQIVSGYAEGYAQIVNDQLQNNDNNIDFTVHFQEKFNETCFTKTIADKNQKDISINFNVNIVSKEYPCIYISIRSSTSRSWHFMVPPTPLADEENYFCFETATDDINNDNMKQFTLKFPSHGGYHILNFFRSKKMFPRSIVPNLVHTNPPKLYVRVIKYSIGSIAKENKLLTDAFKNVRNDEKDEIQEAKLHWQENARKYKSHRLHTYLYDIKTKEDLMSIVHPKMQEALLFDDFNKILTKTRTEVYRFPILKLNVSQNIIEEIENAKHFFLDEELRLPNNVGRKRGPQTGVVLSEIGLFDFSQALVKYILAPLGKIAYPLWGGLDVDSFHSFSLHVVPNNHGEARIGESYLRTHIDICEFSMNICLGSTFQGGDVLFQNAGIGVNNKSKGYTTVPHRPGFAFLNLCQQFHGTNTHRKGARHSLVIRALSSSFRRSPGEVFFSKCGGGDSGMIDEVESIKKVGGMNPFGVLSAGTKKMDL